MLKLITLLGKGQKGGEYRSANYIFPDDSKPKEGKYFGLLLAEKMCPDEIIVFGTRGSMWDNLFLQLFEKCEHEDCLEKLEKLERQIADNAVQQDLLDDLSVIVSKRLKKKYICKLISYAKSEEEQIDFIKKITQCINMQDEIVLDITHGLRHLPLLVQQVGMLLPVLKQVTIQGIYYGALDLTEDNKTPVLRLDGLFIINECQNTLIQYDKIGRLNVFYPLLKKMNVDQNILFHLKKADFFEGVHNIESATKEAKKFWELLKKEKNKKDKCSPVFHLFFSEFEKRIKWVKNDSEWKRQCNLADIALKNREFIMAALYAHEAFSKKIMESVEIQIEKNDINNYVRQRIKKDKEASKYYNKLNTIRNKLAHGYEETSKPIDKILTSEKKLSDFLQKVIDFIPSREFEIE